MRQQRPQAAIRGKRLDDTTTARTRLKQPPTRSGAIEMNNYCDEPECSGPLLHWLGGHVIDRELGINESVYACPECNHHVTWIEQPTNASLFEGAQT